MHFQYLALDECDQAKGIVVVIDVLRAFSTAAYAFDAGAGSIAVVRTLEEAFEMKKKDPDFVLIGEKSGWPVDGFDYGNATSELVGEGLCGRRMVMRTSAGTLGVVHTEQAETLLAASLVCARSSAEFIRKQQPEIVSFIITGSGPDNFGDEDQACADYISDLLMGRSSDLADLKRRVLNSGWGRRFGNPDYPFLNPVDKDYCTRIDAFDFYMLYEESNEGKVFRAHTGETVD